MRAIDCHTHIDENGNNNLFHELIHSDQIDAINIIAVKGMWDEATILDQIKKVEARLKGKSIYLTAGLDKLSVETAEQGYYEPYSLLKIHPRIQHLDAPSIHELFETLREKQIRKPVMIDMFPYRNGTYKIAQYNPLEYEELLNDFPEYNIVFAHFGGIYLREVFMMMKCYKNLWADTSLISRYFRDSPLEGELYYFIKRLEGERVLYGSDYPELPLDDCYTLQYGKMIAAGMSDNDIQKVMSTNFLKLINHE